MARRGGQLAGLLAAARRWLVIAAVPAGADVVDPRGAVQRGRARGRRRASPGRPTDFNSDDVIEIPQQDTVLWGGGVGDAELGDEVERREISGEVEVDIAGIGSATSTTGAAAACGRPTRASTSTTSPTCLLNVKMRLHGEHREGGVKVCSGSVYLQVKAGRFENPLAIAALIGMLATGGGLASAGVVRKKWAFEDINRG